MGIFMVIIGLALMSTIFAKDKNLKGAPKIFSTVLGLLLIVMGTQGLLW